MKLRIWISWLAMLVFVLIAYFYVRRNGDALARTQLVRPMAIIWIGLFMALRITLRGVFQWQTMRRLGCRIPCREALSLNYVGTMMNMLLPMPFGPAYRGAYLKRLHGFPYTLFASTLAALFVFFLTISCLVGLGSLVWLRLHGQVVPLPLWGLLFGVASVGMATLLLPEELSADNAIVSRLNRILAGWKALREDRQLMLAAAGVVLISILSGMVALWAAFHAFGNQVDLPLILVLMSSQQVGSLIKLTPGAIGFQEMVSVYFASSLSVTMVDAVVALALARIINILVALLLGLPCLFLLSRVREGDSDDA